MTERKDQADQNDPNTPLEELNPVPLEESDEPGAAPPKEWGEKGQGEDGEDPNSEEVPQDGN